MNIPDELAVEIQQYETNSETTTKEIAFRTFLAAIPYAGGAILEITNGLAQRRAQERVNHVFEQMKTSLAQLSEEKVDQAYFHSEEFQTLLYLLLERLHTTHDAEKLRMFGTALSNTGNLDFKSAPKEDYVRILRDLSTSDLIVLNDERLKGWLPHLPHVKIEYAPEILVSLFRLQGMGLVIGKAVNLMNTQINEPPRTTFSLSGFGERFLAFISQNTVSDGSPTENRV